MIELKNVNFSYSDTAVLKDFSLSVKTGECVCLKGESGCGKTTVLRLILGLEAAQSGTVTVDGTVSAVFQEDRLIESLSLDKNLELITNDTLLTSDLIKKAELETVANKKIADFSGGMKRRAAIIRAIAFGGDALILDEPFNGLDLENKQKMASLIKEQYLEKGKPVLLISHIEEDARLLNAKIVEM